MMDAKRKKSTVTKKDDVKKKGGKIKKQNTSQLSDANATQFDNFTVNDKVADYSKSSPYKKPNMSPRVTLRTLGIDFNHMMSQVRNGPIKNNI